jgi:hypothetical protein
MDIEYQDILNHIKEIDSAEMISKSVSHYPKLDATYEEMLTSADNEIIVDLNINIISRQDEYNFVNDTNRNYINNYRIPVPSGEDSTEYLIAFIERFEKALQSSVG